MLLNIEPVATAGGWNAAAAEDQAHVGLPRKLLHPLAPRTGESIPSFLIRSCAHNFIERPRHLFPEVGYAHSCIDRAARTPLPIAEKLASVLGIDPKEVISRLYVPCNEPAGPPMLDFFGVRVRSSYLCGSARRIAPASMLGDGNDHHRAVWGIKPLSFCRETATMLIDRCQNPACGAPLRWLTAQPLPVCGKCRADQRNFPVEPVPAGDRDALCLVAALVDADQQVRDDARKRLPQALHVVDHGTLFELALTLSRFWSSDDGPMRPVKGGEWPIERLAHGARMLQEWPTSLEARLKREREAAPNQFCTTPLGALLKRLLADKTMLPEVRALLKVHFGTLIASGQRFLERVRRHSQKADLINMKEAVSYVTISASELARLREAGILNSRRLTGRKRIIALYSRSDVLELQHALDARLGYDEFTARTGLRMPEFEQLVCEGVLRRCDHPAIEALFPGLHVDRQSLDALLQRVRSLSKPLDPADAARWLPLRDAMRHVGGQEKPWGPLFSHVMQHALDLRVPQDMNGEERLADLLVPADILPNGLGRHFRFDSSQHCDFEFSPHLTDDEACELLNCLPRELYLLIEHGHLRIDTSRKARRIVRESVERVAKAAISSLEVAARLGMPARSVASFLRTRGISASFKNRFWPRRAVEPLFARNYVNLGDWRRQCRGATRQAAEAGACDLTDAEWTIIERAIGSRSARSKIVADRDIINAVLWIETVGKRWRDLPERYGSSPACQKRYSKWRTAGTWTAVLRALHGIDEGQTGSLAAAV